MNAPNTPTHPENQAARDIRESLEHGTSTDPFPPTKEAAWDAIEKRLRGVIKPHLDDAYAAGKADGLREAQSPE